MANTMSRFSKVPDFEGEALRHTGDTGAETSKAPPAPDGRTDTSRIPCGPEVHVPRFHAQRTVHACART